MIKVHKDNRYVRVTENELDKYLAKGYTIVEDKPVVKQAPQPQPKAEEPKFAKVYKSVSEEKVAEQPKTRKRKK